MRALILKLCFVICPIIFSSLCIAQPGTLDSSFGTNGVALTTIPGSAGGVMHTIQQPDGKILVTGAAYSTATLGDFQVSRLLPDGRLDSSFGNNGVTIFDFFGQDDDCNAIALQSDGKIILGGVVYRASYTPALEFTGYFGLARLTKNGKIDSTFGIKGKVFTNPDTVYNDFACYAVAVQKDDKIIAAGYGGKGPNKQGFCAIRYTKHGVVDGMFGTGGLQIIEDGGGNARAIMIDSKQNILLAGSTYIFPNSEVKLARLKTSGLRDSTFGTNGITFTDIKEFQDGASAIAIQEDGKIVVAGGAQYDYNYSYSFAARYTAHGRLDTSFATKGIAIIDFGGKSCGANSVIMQTDGKILLGGFNKKVVFLDNYKDNFALARLQNNGALDSGFGVNGKAETSLYNSVIGRTVFLQPDNKILFLGSTFFNGSAVATARYKNDPPLTISIKKNIAVTEENTGTTAAKFTVNLNRPSAYDVFVNYSTKDASAMSGSDYLATSGTLKIKAGGTAGQILVPVIGDVLTEPNEKFNLIISNPVHAALGTTDTAACIIKNDDLGFVPLTNTTNIPTATSIRLYPNPVSAILRIEGLDANAKWSISVIDINGKVVATDMATSGTITLRVAQLPAGNYLVKIQRAQGSQILRFVKE